MSNDKKRIIFVSRLDADCSLGARILCDIAPALLKGYESIEIIIIGGGSELPRIRSRALKINQKINQQLIKIIGGTENPSKFFSRGALFVGVSRAALEAMAQGLGVVLLGNEGYLGLLDASKITRAEWTNFTCREENGDIIKDRARLGRALYFDACRYFDMSDEERTSLSLLMKNTVEQGYDSSKMALQTLDFYRKVALDFQRSTPIKISLCGYYGYGNFGDEIILRTLTEEVLCKYPRAKICVLDRKNPIKLIENLWRCDVFVFGGGSLLQNSTSDASLFYYILIIFVAAILSSRTVMLSNGLGPITAHGLYKSLLNKVIGCAVNTFDFISARDTASRDQLKKLLPKRRIHLVPDPALLAFSNLGDDSSKSRKTLVRTGFFVLFSHSRALKNARISGKTIAKLLLKISFKYKCDPLIGVLNEKEDLPMARDIARASNKIKIVSLDDLETAVEILKNARFTVSQRYHGALLSICTGTPTLAVSKDPKMIGLCRDFGISPCAQPSVLSSFSSTDLEISQTLAHFSESSERTQDIVLKFTERTKGIKRLL